MTTNNNEFAQVVFDDFTNHVFPASSDLIELYEKIYTKVQKTSVKFDHLTNSTIDCSSQVKKNRATDPIIRQIRMYTRYLSQGRQVLFRSAALNERVCFRKIRRAWRLQFSRFLSLRLD